jgi:hypothetical protein
MAQFYCVHVYDIRPEVSTSEFERFILEEWIPFVMRKRGCMGAMLLQGYQGEWIKQKMDYATIDIWSSPEANRAAWGGPSNVWVDPPDLRPLMEQFRTYVIPESFRTYEFELLA